ncbi:MAG: ABC transporter permease [Candidatus Thermoplasmatota archaeon]|nr:ABC transporter permease [Candidatus Thermoplasmatota archaeon]
MKSIKEDILEDMRNTCLTVSFELKKHFRMKRMIISFALAVGLPLIFYIVPKIWASFPDTAEQFANLNLSFVNLLIIISGSLFAGDAVVGEFEEKTGLLLFSTPQRHSTIFIGKYIGALLPTLTVVSIYYLTTSLEIIGIYGTGGITVEFYKSFLIGLIYTTSAVSLIFFFSSILKRKITSTLLGFFSLMMILPIMSSVLQFLVEVEPWYILTYFEGLITDVFVGAPSLQGGPGGEGTQFSPDFYQGIIVMVAYTIVLFFLGLFIADQRRME